MKFYIVFQIGIGAFKKSSKGTTEADSFLESSISDSGATSNVSYHDRLAEKTTITDPSDVNKQG